MRTAAEYYYDYSNLLGMDKEDFVEVLNEARKECIEECAKKIFGNVYNGAKWDVTDSLKGSILNLINELK